LNKQELSQKEEKMPQLQDLLAVAVEAMQDRKAVNIISLDLSNVDEASTNIFLICHGTSSTHINGIAKNIEKTLWEQLGERPNHTEGKQGGHWRLLDYFTLVIHVFNEEKRKFYNLEGLWSDANRKEYPTL